MPRPSATPEQKSIMRNKIRDAVLRIAKRMKLGSPDVRGWDQITIRHVIEEAGISTGTFYKYFKNRADLGQYLWSEPVDKLRSEMQLAFDQAMDPASKVRSLLEHYRRFAIDNRRVFKGVFLNVRPEGEQARETVDLGDEIFYKNLVAAFLEGQKSGAFKSFEVREMAQLFWASMHGSLALPINLDRYDFDAPETLTASMIDALLAMIAISPEQL